MQTNNHSHIVYPTIYGSNSSTILVGNTFGANIYTNPNVPNGTYTIGTSSTGTTWSTIEYKVKRCRDCKHAHLEGQQQCLEVLGSMVTFASCHCKEYVPEDNLEYLAWKHEKRNSSK